MSSACPHRECRQGCVQDSPNVAKASGRWETTRRQCARTQGPGGSPVVRLSPDWGISPARAIAWASPESPFSSNQFAASLVHTPSLVPSSTSVSKHLRRPVSSSTSPSTRLTSYLLSNPRRPVGLGRSLHNHRRHPRPPSSSSDQN